MNAHKVSITLCSALLIISSLLLPMATEAADVVQQANGSDYLTGLAAGQQDSKGSAWWILGGIGCGIFAVAGAALIPPSAPTQALMGKPSAYVIGYSEGYKKGRWKNVAYASGGCAAYSVVYLATDGFGLNK
jgi:hypothetical protein